MTLRGLVTESNGPACVAVQGSRLLRLERAQKRLLRLYRKLKHRGGWRAVQLTVGSRNWRWPYEFATYGRLPANAHERDLLLHWRASGDEYGAVPAGLAQRVLAIVDAHDVAHKVHGDDLLTELRQLGHKVDDRQRRAAVRQLRREGKLICSLAGKNGGYWMAKSMEEYEAFEMMELGAKIADMEETRAAMRKAARRQFSAVTPVEQLELIE